MRRQFWAVSLAAALLSLGMVPLTVAGPLDVPNEFTAGTTARAAQVNANFAAVESAVNDNDTRITSNTSDIASNVSAIALNTSAIAALQSAPPSAGPRVVDAVGNEVGLLVNITDDNRFVSVLSDLGYVLVELEIGTPGVRVDWGFVAARPQALRFSTPDCSGTPFVYLPAGFAGMFFTGGGVALYYVDKAGAFVGPPNQIGSETSLGQCIFYDEPIPIDQILQAGFTPLPALLNVEAVTGIPDAFYQTLPLTIDR